METATDRENIKFDPIDVRNLRRDLGWTIRRMASELGVATSTLNHWMIEPDGPDGLKRSGYARPGRLALRALQSLREALESGEIEPGNEYGTKRRRVEIDRDRLQAMVYRIETRKKPPETMEQLCRAIADSYWGRKNEMYETLIRSKIAECGIATMFDGKGGEGS